MTTEAQLVFFLGLALILAGLVVTDDGKKLLELFWQPAVAPKPKASATPTPAFPNPTVPNPFNPTAPGIPTTVI